MKKTVGQLKVPDTTDSLNRLSRHPYFVCNSLTADSLGDHSLLCISDANPRRTTLWHDASYRVWARLLKSVGYSVTQEAHNALLSDSMKRPDLLIHDHSAGGPNTFIDFITCVVSKSTSVVRGASLPGAAADNGANEKNSDWLDLVQAQDDTFVAIAQEDGGALNPAALDLLESAVRRAGGTKGEKAAMRTYWRQRIAVANARGVAGVIRARTPICTGAHWPLQPHHFSHLPDLCPIARLPRAGAENLIGPETG